MIKICEISIERFRSIIKIDYMISNDNNLIAFCGQNNVGKTNSLRAINLFFNPDSYEPEVDMPRIKHATGGGATHPKITVTFFDDTNNKFYTIIRNIGEYIKIQPGLKGISYKLKGKSKIDKNKLEEHEIIEFLDKIEFTYIESINILIPELIEKLTSDMIDVQYDKARFSETKKDLKKAYDTYIDGLQSILNSFASDISETFKEFQNSWSVKFDVPKSSDTFRELISDDVALQLDDSGSIGIEDKGAGLQRLATILLQFEMLSRLHNRKQIIACIDEPDVFLHEGLQRKLKKFFDEKAQTMQLFFTTHSKVFINPYNMKNVFLLMSRSYSQYSSRKKKDIQVIETYLENIKEESGYNKICEHLGIEQHTYEPIQAFNLIVEGGCDKKYFTELCKYFGIDVPNIISLNGADNALKYLDFYDSYYKNVDKEVNPKLRMIFDNDSKGREIYKKVKSKVNDYRNISVECQLIQNYLGDADIFQERNNTNNEIEDFLYPELVCYLINNILPKMKLAKMDVNTICKNVKKHSFKTKGILSMCEHEKNEKNPEEGGKISFCSSGNETNRFKDNMAGMFNIEANIKLLDLLEQCNKKYPYVKNFLSTLCVE